MRSDDESGFLARTIPAADGLKLHVRDYVGDEAATGMRPAIFCLPGLTRNSRDFHQLALLLSRDAANPRRVITLDARGRGASEWDADKSHYNLVVEAQDVLTVCSALALPHAIFIGTSRGGLVLHVIAASRPDILKAVILNDIGPVLEKRGLADIRDYLNRDKKPSDWDDAVEILRENHGSAFSALSEDDWRDMAFAIYAPRDGKPVPDYDPAIAAQMQALDLEAPIPDLWPQFQGFQDIPLMVIRGENSKLLVQSTTDEMASRHPGMVIKIARGQGHAPILHLADIPDAIRSFISEF
ncbi:MULTISPECIES: alpha/beta hydrolase [unclassified Rhizobium]|jgi:pimeloyl-ACP methyl ester carboxylesterase|uniref:alpha/beta fold hydrolase n=1 Tax=unclassified Rhizobium TaxID=2613769 RepID=UPI000647057C|nr:MULTISPECIES: alpha/beta hydrolase [unclassified Rhizobium]MBN8951072.1 alpha/beta hydrolase [Rhizobium tropici]OJY69172.1 MAG: alpha/beta hydrolase [Rhizobium sp. 60-20]RKD73943.1 pimeloyl-ACP methyl ester carboxylesterase [Rhizobium sp. WW_1]